MQTIKNPRNRMRNFVPNQVAKLMIVTVVLTVGACSSIGWQVQTMADEKSVTKSSTVNNTIFTLEEINPDLIGRQKKLKEESVVVDPELLVDTTNRHDYQIASGDILNVSVWGHPDLMLGNTGNFASADSQTINSGYTVNANGYIQFPFVGSVKVAGLTELQARDELTQRLQRFYIDPQVVLKVQQYRGKHVYVAGSVKTPGQVTISDIPMTLPEALSRVGGPDNEADTSHLVLTRDKKAYEINLPQLISHAINPATILLKENDILRVTPREETMVSVIGEVNSPGRRVTHNGALSLTEALSESGGINAVASNAGQIYVIRQVNTSEATVYHIAVRAAENLALADQFELKARDIVFVNSASIAQWNRVITLLFGSVSAVETTNNTLHNR